jgi:VanZ family protein
MCVLAGIIYLSLIPNYSASIITFDGADKLKHTFAYFVLGVTASFALPKHCYFRALVGFWVMGAVLELLQDLQLNRTASVYDLVANTVGLILAYVAVKALTRE